MKNKQLHKKVLYIVITLLLLMLTVISGGVTASAFAETKEYTNVLDDLFKDTNFNASEYPINVKDNSLKVIQIAEGTEGELYLYVYQPSAHVGDLKATSVNMSLSEDIAGTKLYDLILINSNGVFYKYRVKGFTVSTSGVRYYNITSIYRAWDKEIDGSTGNDNEINEVSYEVGQRWTASTAGGVVSYNTTKTETVLVTDKYVDFIEYRTKVTLGYSYYDAHYVAFSTDFKIEELYEADVYFLSQDYRERYSSSVGGMKDIYTWEVVEHYITLTGTDRGENVGGILYPHYEWERIQSVSDFKSSLKSQNITLSESTENNLSNKQWVLRFYESDSYWQDGVEHWGTRVTDVTILRLKFMTNGVVYNLGVVDNKQTSDDKPGNQPDIKDEDGKMNFWQWFWNCIVKTFTGAGAWYEIAITVVTIVIAVVALVLIVKFLRFVINGLRGK